MPLEIRYLGSGGVLMRYGPTVVMTAPFFSHAGVVATGLRDLEHDRAAIEKHMPRVPSGSVILVGHAHYDHLFDVPFLIEERIENPVIYGSNTTKHLLAAVDKRIERKVIALNERAWTPGLTTEPEFIAIEGAPNVRFLPIRSEHAPHFLGIELWAGRLEADLGELPNKAADWPRGLALSYLLEFLDDQRRVVHRVYYQDAAAGPTMGHPPSESGAVDVALIAAPSFEQVNFHPEAILGALRPRTTVFIHWEDFFRPYTQDVGELRRVRLTDHDELSRRTEAALGDGKIFFFPTPGTCLVVGEEGSHCRQP